MPGISLNRDGARCVLLLSCLGDGDTGGGLLLYDGQATRILDRNACTGLTTHGNTVVRTLWSPHQEHTGSRIQVIGPSGLREIVVPGFTDPHDILWTGQHYAAVSAYDDAILWVAPDGSFTRRLQFSGGGDAWHLNCLLQAGGKLLATAFGRYSTPRGWHERRSEPAGMLFAVETGEDILTQLHCPHSPRLDSEGLYVCSSMTSQVALYDWRTLAPLRQVQLEGWTRGIGITDDFVLVGESVNRNQSSDTRGATVAILDRETLKLRSRLRLPFREVYDLLPVPDGLGAGVARSLEREVPVGDSSLLSARDARQADHPALERR